MKRRTLLGGIAGALGLGGGTAYAAREHTDRPWPIVGGTYDASAQELQLSVQDFDELGWKLRDDDSYDPAEYGPEGATCRSVSDRDFENDGQGVTVTSEVAVFDTPDGARKHYRHERSSDTSSYSSESVDVGDDGYGYIDDGDALVKFRDANVYAEVKHWPPMPASDLSDAMDYVDLLRSGWR